MMIWDPSPNQLPIVARRPQPHARAVRGRSISYTNVHALPESLGQCKLLVELCVPRPPPRRRARVCGVFGVALLRVLAAALLGRAVG